MIAKIAKKISNKISYEIELFSQIFFAFASGWIYGIIESQWIDTSHLAGKKLFGFWHYYHVWMMALLACGSLWLAFSHIQWILKHQKKYILIMCLAGICMSALVEDISWYVTNWEPILRDDWTMMKPGLGLNFFSITYIPLWYFVTLFVVIFLYCLSNYYANKGYAAYVNLTCKDQN